MQVWASVKQLHYVSPLYQSQILKFYKHFLKKDKKFLFLLGHQRVISRYCAIYQELSNSSIHSAMIKYLESTRRGIQTQIRCISCLERNWSKFHRFSNIELGGGGQQGRLWGNKMVMDRDMTWVLHIDDVLWRCAPATCTILLTRVTKVNSIKRGEDDKYYFEVKIS